MEQETNSNLLPPVLRVLNSLARGGKLSCYGYSLVMIDGKLCSETNHPDRFIKMSWDFNELSEFCSRLSEDEILSCYPVQILKSKRY